MQGKATFSNQGSQLTVQTSDYAYINWQSFNIDAGETTTFLQPSSSSLVWNHINDSNPSQILGNLNANGYVVLQNQSGFYVGGSAVINARGLVMTTAPAPMPDLAGGGPWQFSAPPPSASIVNYGQINLGKGGSVFLISQTIENQGTISAPQGSIGLYAGQEVLVSQRPDGRGLTAKVTLPQGSVDNNGNLIADAGSIALQAQVVNQGGLVRANSIREVNGAIEFAASQAINLGANSSLEAEGGANGVSPGGSVTIKSGQTFTDQPGSTISIAGGAQGGNGGQVEISAPSIGAIHSQIDGHAAGGFLAGKLTIDPQDILLTTPGSPAPASGTVNAGDPPSAGTLTLDVNSFNNLISQGSLSQISLQATRDIEVATLWSLPDSQAPNALLSLQAGRNITIDDGAGIAAGMNWSVSLKAGTELTSAAQRVSGQDGVYLQGSAYIQTQNGNISIWAGNEVLLPLGSAQAVVNSGIRTLNGGSVSVSTLYGDVNCGDNPAGYLFQGTAPYYTVSTDTSSDLGLGGISTAAGGNVSINAGRNVYSYLGVSTSGATAGGDAGSGAFGPEPGNVSIAAGGSVYGHYVVANGTGTIMAGENIGGSVASQNVALSLIKGDWNLDAPRGSIYLQEVRNPNGVFNNTGAQNSPGQHLFDYDPQSSVSLDAGGGVYLTCLSLPRPNDAVPVIFPPELFINSGSGGVTVQGNVTLFPSEYQDLQIATSGNFLGNPNQPGTIPQFLMSDSAQSQWLTSTTFGARDHGDIPPGLNEPQPISIEVGGNMANLNLITTRETRITVGGDMDNCGFSGQNLHSSDVTSINVAGQIYNRSPYSFVFLSQSLPSVPVADLPPNMGLTWDSIFSLLVKPSVIATLTVPSDIPAYRLGAYAIGTAALFPAVEGVSDPGFVYDAATRRLGFQGQMSASILAALSGPLLVLRYGPDGLPVTYVGQDGQRHFATDTVSFAPSAAISTLYAESQGAPSPTAPGIGYRVGGPGTFDVNAGSIQLGNSYGIFACGASDFQGGFARYGNLAALTPSGANLNVTVNGDLDMETSTIANIGGGNLNVTSLSGAMDLGSQELFGTRRELGFGVYTTGRGNVTVTALGDIDIDGSRIAAYNGGNIFVESLQGNVNAGSGGATTTGAAVSFVNPITGQGGSYAEEVYGSGIVANTLVSPSLVPGSATTPGNVTVETPKGSIFASQGGILQEALDGSVAGGPTVNLVAGTAPSASSPGYTGNIDLGNSGVIGGTVNVRANGSVNGLVIARQSTTINVAQSFSGTVLAGGSANVSAGGSVSGTVIGVVSANVSGGQGITATVLSQNASVGGAAASSTLGSTAAGTTASAAAAATSSSDTRQQLAQDTPSTSDDVKKKAKPVLVRRVGRVTVILPKS
jgi:filamentous hemagglutinin family protein